MAEDMNMKNSLYGSIRSIFALILFAIMLISCGSSNSTTTVSNGVDLKKYRYVVFGSNGEGDAELDDVMLSVHNEISTHFYVVEPLEALDLIKQGEYVVSPKISAKSEKWDGGHTYITVSFYDYKTDKLVAVCKSSGIGLSIADDQKKALNAIKMEMIKYFPIIHKK